MATKSQTIIDNKLENPIAGSTGVAVFIGLILVGAGIAFVLCSEIVDLPEWIKEVTLQIYCLVISLGWFSFTANKNSKDLFDSLWGLGFLTGVIAGMIINPHPAFFWFSLLAVVGIGIIDILDEVLNGWNLLSACLYITWIVAGAFITLGRTSYLPYASPILAISQIHFLLDIRFLVTGLVLLIFTGKAIIEAFDEGTPTIPSLPQLRLQDIRSASGDFVAAVLQPFVIIINAILVVIQKITNVIWQVIATVAVYLFRTGSNLANHFLDVVLNSRIWLSVFRALYSFIVILSVALIVKSISPSIRSYLVSNTSLSSLSSENMWNIILLAGMFAFILILIVSLCKVWRILDKPLSKAAFGGSMLMITWSLAGGVMYCLKLFDVFKLYGFESFGVYTLLIILIVSSVFIFQIIKRLLLS